jgi:hypothetical protein
MHKNDGSNDFCMSFLTSTKVYENNESTEEAQECEGSMRTNH